MTGSTADVPAVAVVGVHGHGASHVARALQARAEGRARLTAVADPRAAEADHVPADVARHASLEDLLAAGVPDVVVLSTPIHTHAELATAAMEAGAAVLLEKPPTATPAELDALLATSRRTGRPCQVGFQSLGSRAVDHVRGRVADGRLGEVTGWAATGCWIRPRSYWQRSSWAGRRVLDGRVVADGVLTNPLAHSLATALAVAGRQAAGDVLAVDPDLYRVNDVEADDTSSLRVRLRESPDLLAAVTLCAGERGEPAVVVEGTAGRATLYYAVDVVVEEVPGRPPLVTRHARADLLDDLLAHLRTGAPLLSPLERTGAFTAVLDAVTRSPAPHRVAERFVERVPLPGGDEHRRLRGVEEAVALALSRRALFRELDLPWTRTP
ncbi:Gfo/Idh/MocA family protein [Kineococcus terrestris]|uniref:Gfo/Idh/MocA family protein n=1 Tax=Kineococcus terrestris TaxID=2044856 RepID=UPI0034DB3FA3